MIEKIMKALKSNNKKRGRNITIGAVVGMLLSCTVVMGEDVSGLDIAKGDTEIEFSKDGNKFEPEKEGDPYPESTWDKESKTYTNNTLISGESAEEKGYGVKLSGDLSELNFINNSSISAIGEELYSRAGYGIYNEDGSVKTITNNGSISGDMYAIYNYSLKSGSTSSIEEIINSGIISSLNYGIGNVSGSEMMSSSSTSSIGEIINNGNIFVKVVGINNSSNRSDTSSIENITNTGSIYGGNRAINNYGSSATASIGKLTNTGSIYSDYVGIYNTVSSKYGGTASIGNIINGGVIGGYNNAIRNENGTIGGSYNYGILLSESLSSSIPLVDGISIVASTSTPSNNQIANYGLAFTNKGSNKYTNHGDSDENHNFGEVSSSTVEIEGIDYIVRNVKANVDGSGEITNIKSFKIDGGKLFSDTSEITDGKTTTSNVILNGIEETLKVRGTGNELSKSIINAYKTAIKFDDAGGSLTLSETIVNEGLGGAGKVILGGDGEDTLTLKNGTIINGEIDGGGDDDTLNFGKTAIVKAGIASNSDDEIRVLHNISNFENININSNVTFYEKTGKHSKQVIDLTVTGASEIKINAGGVLTLRIDSSKMGSSDDDGKIIGHALYGNDGEITSTGGGKLLLALNGAGNESVISFGDTTLDKSLVTAHETKIEDEINFATTSKLHMVKRVEETSNEVIITAKADLPTDIAYEKLNEIYHSILSVEDLIGNFNVDDDEKLSTFLGYLNDIYAGNPYSYSSELSRKSAGMFRDIVTENIFRPETNKWMIYGGLTHVDGGTKDTYYGKGYYTYDIGSSDMDADTKITGAYMLGEYGVSDTLTSGVVIGGNKLKSDLSNGSKVDGSALYLGAYAKKYVGNLKVTAGAGFQYGDYDADRLAVNKVASSTGESVMKYSDNYNDITYDIYLNGRYSHQVGDNLFLEPYATLSYTYVDQDGANEGSKVLAIETDSKSFDYTVGKVGVDLKKVIPHEKGKSTLTAGVSYTKIFDGADEEYITGRFKGGSNFDILVAHKNEHSIGLNAKYALELENGVIFDVKGTYSVERDSHNQSGKNRTKGEWIVGAGLGYKF